MITIKRLEIKNFQSHEYSDLYFDEGVNIIIGPSDSGKTAIIRAIKWVLYNEPSGSDFIRKGSKEAIVSLYFSNDLIITRGRSKSKNYYEVTFPSKKTERYEGFGTKVPEEIIELTQIYKVNLDGNNLISLSISDQLESPFLLTESPSVKAVAIGKIAGVENIDLALSNISKEINEINSRKKLFDKEKFIHEENLKNFDYLGREKENLQYIESIISKINNKQLLLNKYKKNLEKYNSILRLNSKIKLELNKYKDIELLEDIILNLRLSNDKLNKTNSLQKNYSNIYNNIKFQNNIIANTNNIDKIIEKYFKIQEIFIKYSQLELLEKKIIPLNSKIELLEKYLKNDNTSSLIKIMNKLSFLNNEYSLLKDKDEYLNLLNKRIYNGEIYITKFKNISFFEKNIYIADEKYNRYIKLNKLSILLTKLNASIDKTEDFINRNFEYNKIIIDKYISILKISGICPYCFNKLDEEHLNKIIKKYGV